MGTVTGASVGHAELATLKHLALRGALGGEEKVSCSGMAEHMDVSTQTVSRRLQGLEEAGHVEREVVGDGQWVAVTEAGETALQREYADYRRIFEGETEVTLEGTVTSGMGEGRHYISLSGYMEQFVDRLGYEPFAGTLNVDLTPESVRARSRLSSFEPITIDGWESEDRTYGPAYCYPASIEAGPGAEGGEDGPDAENGESGPDAENGESGPDAGADADSARVRFDRSHVITPERTHHDEDQLEVIAPVKLRDELDLSDGSSVRVHVTE